jgi:serine/threonine-protein kinase
MPFVIPLDQAQADYPQYTFLSQLTPSEQKAAFHVKDIQGHDLCLKIIAPSYNLDRLDREIEALQSISHPNVVRLIEYTKSSSSGRHRHYMVEEFIAGNDLGELLHPTEQWSRQNASLLFAALFEGLAALDRLNIVHRDLKPSNIRVRPNGSPVIIDFGLARLLDRPDLTSTSEGAAIGTLLYFSPEQCTGTKHDIDHRTDLFAAGVLLYQALTGSHPFWQNGISEDQFREAICQSHDCLNAPEFLTLPRPWQIIVGRLLNKERAMRPHNATQVADILRRIGGL